MNHLREKQNHLLGITIMNLLNPSLGATFGDMVEILSGLKAGDRVVVTPPKGLKDGSRIKVAER